MWPFNRKHRKEMAQFAKFVPPEVINEILVHPEEEWPPSRKVFIGYLVIQARDDNLEALERMVPRTIEIITQHRGAVDSPTLSLITAFFGASTPARTDPAATCQAAAKDLLQELGRDLKIVYGSGEAIVGSWGHPQLTIYGARFPAFSQRLEKLCEMSYGEIDEMNF